MKIAVVKERHDGENRIAMMPATVGKLVDKGITVLVEEGIGTTVNCTDAMYREAGAEVVADKKKLLAEGDIVIRLRKPPQKEVAAMKSGSIHVSYLDPFNESSLIDAFAEAGLRDKVKIMVGGAPLTQNFADEIGISAISMEMIPRTTIAQKMDAISSQASLAGYVAVILAAENFDSIFPMMMTPAGTLSPAKIFIIGAGVAGLQAIATAKRLGARVEAFDTRAVVEEEVKSLGGKFIKIDLGETGQDKDGYAKALTPEQLEIQRQGIAKVCAKSDIVITTAQLFGRKAPRIMTNEMVTMMKPGSVIIDMAVESGGNVEGSEVDKIVDVDGVKIIGYGNLPGRVPRHASEMFSSNIYNLLEELWDEETKIFALDTDNDIVKGCLITHDGAVVNETIKNLNK